MVLLWSILPTSSVMWLNGCFGPESGLLMYNRGLAGAKRWAGWQGCCHGHRYAGSKRPLLPRQVWSIRVRLEMSASARDLTLFNLAIDSKLRASDLVRLKVDVAQT